MEKEIWKDVPNYEGIYQVSNLGRVKSLSRIVISYNGGRLIKERILKQSDGWCNYLTVLLCNDGKRKTITVHKLVAIVFLGHIPNGYEKVVDHINNVRTDNRLENLQIITARENCTKDRKKGSSIYIGVCWSKDRKKWISQIRIKNKNKVLGKFDNEIDAHNAYKTALNNLQE